MIGRFIGCLQITDIFASKCKKNDANDWHVFPGGRWGYHIEYIQISRNSIQKSYKYFANIVQMIGMFSQEEDGVTIWGPARGRSPLPQQVAANFF